MPASPFAVQITPDWEGLVACIRRQGTPKRVHHIELYLDREVQDAIAARYGVFDGLSSDDPYFEAKRLMLIQRFLGYDFVRCGVEQFDFPLVRVAAADTAELAREGGRKFQDEHRGPITSWAEFEAYPWPDPHKASTRNLEWYEKNLPDDMCVIAGGGFGHFCEYLTWLMGYETLCYALFDQRDLVQAIADRLLEMYRVTMARLMEFKCIKMSWGSDDMGFRSGTLISPDDLRAFVFPGHKMLAQMSHDAGRPYLLHSCGNLREVMDDLIDDVKIDAKHSFEDTIEDVIEDKRIYGHRIALLGGIDMDFLCRASEADVRARVRRTLEANQSGGGYVLGTGNTMANYVPLNNYLAMLDEGRKFGA